VQEVVGIKRGGEGGWIKKVKRSSEGEGGGGSSKEANDGKYGNMPTTNILVSL